MLVLSLIWIGVGVVVAALALGARLRLAVWGRYGWLVLLGIGAAAGLIGGWIGTFVFGRFFGTATALWVSVLVVVVTPWLATRRERARARRRATAS